MEDLSWTTVATVTVVVGTALVAMRWLGCTVHRLAELPMKVVEVEKEELFRFLSDPRNLKLVHALTTEIRLEDSTENTDGTCSKKFVWVEKVPFTVQSYAHLHCDPSASAITFDITQRPSLFKVRSEWRLEDPKSEDGRKNHHRPSQTTSNGERAKSDDCDQTGRANGRNDAAARTITEGDDDTRGTITRRRTQEGADGHADFVRPRHTEFHNRIQLTGPRVVLPLVMFPIKRAQSNLMQAVQKHFRQ